MYEIGYLWYDEENDRERASSINFNTMEDAFNWLINCKDEYVSVVSVIKLED